jgi:transcriptional regulator NrdR family protein
MKRRAEHLVLKRDGRREFLRATKLARSVHLALYSVGVDEDWRAIEIANVVLQGLRQKRQLDGVDAQIVLTTAEISDAVQHLLVVTGQPTAAVSFGAVAAERTRRRQSLAAMSRAGALAAAAAVTAGLGARARRLQE